MAKLKELLEAKIQYANDLEEEVAEQYVESFDEALKQVSFLYARLDVSSCGYFKEILDGKLVDRLPLGADAAADNQLKSPSEQQVDDSPASS